MTSYRDPLSGDESSQRPAPDARSPEPGVRRPHTVSELIRGLNLDLGVRYASIAVEGEVSQFTRARSGHCYLTIKDEWSQLRVVMFDSEARLLKFDIEVGLQIVARGSLQIYRERGDLQLKAMMIEPAGIGALQLAFEQLKKKLAAEGLFEESRKKRVPMLPQRIAVVTSPTGAAIRDILQVLGRRFADLHVQVYPVKVQGTGSAREIARAIRNLSKWDLHDVVLICRGGGSPEDLWSFNEEEVARAIAECGIPTITGVGHEIDFTIADFVADLRAPTPSAAAEIVIQAKGEIALRIDHATHRIRRIVEGRVAGYRSNLRDLVSASRLGAFPIRVGALSQRSAACRAGLYRLLERQARSLREKLARVREPLHRFPASLALANRKRYVVSLEERLRTSLKSRVAAERQRLRAITTTLDAVSPLSVLARGYAIALDGRDGRTVLTDSAAINVGDPIDVQLRRGKLRATVDGKTFGLETMWPDEGLDED